MVKPWEISGDEIQEWASRFEASAGLPKLVRRLLFATSPLDGIAMRADSGTRYEGWDGVVRTRVATVYCPVGLSVWELSVDKKVRTKLDDDFDKRTKKPPEGVRPKLATYVAVTARRFSKKADWADDKRAEGIWADVRLYDADDLETWLEQAPAVARWFANLHGRPAYEGKDVESFLEEWQKRTSPPLPSALVLAGEDRRAQSDELLAWLGVPADRPLLIRGRTREEALLFAAATLARKPGEEARLSRALVVETEDAWRWALKVQSAERMILLPTFDKPDMGQASAAKVRVILPSDQSAAPQLGSTLTLEEQPFKQLAKILSSAGVSAPDAERLVRRAGGDLEALQRMCGYIDVDLPPWAKNSPRAELLALLLAGAWVPTFDGDREAIRRLGGDPAVVEQLCADLQERKVVKRIAEHFRRDTLAWNAPEVAWGLLVRGLTDSHLERFGEVVMDVLGAMDPAYDLPKDERFMAPVKGKILAHSEDLRQGLAESLALLPLHDAVFLETRGDRKGSTLADGLVKWLLRADRGWRTWASLSKILPLLAEAAPKGFLDRLETSLDHGEEGVAHLFLEEPAAMLGGAPHTGLLWALETLGWHPEESVRRRVVQALARLDAYDPGKAPGRLDNRPLRSLDTLLRYALPKSNTTVEERIDLVRQVFKTNPATGRKLALGMLENLRGAALMHQGYKPRFHEWGPKTESTEIDMRELSAQVRAALEDLVTEAGTDPGCWTDMVEAVLHGPEDVEEHVLDALEKQQKHIQDTDGRLWSTLRKAQTHISPEDIAHARYQRIDALYKHFTPQDLVQRYAWLFEPFPSLPGLMIDDIDVQERRIAEERSNAIEEVWQHSDRWEVLGRAVKAVDQIEHGAWHMGRSLAKSSFVNDLDARLLTDKAEELLAPLIVGFAATRAKELGVTWFEELLVRLVKNHRTEDAAKIASDAVDGRTISYRILWDILERAGEPLLTAYWQTVPRILGDPSIEDLTYAVEHLVAIGREEAAVQSAGLRGRINTTGSLAFYVLDKYRERATRRQSSEQAPGRGFDPLMPHHVEQLFKIIDRDPPKDKDSVKDLAPLELDYLLVLPQRSRPTRYVSLAFSEDMDLFVGLIRILDRGEGEERPVKQDEDRARAAQNAFGHLRREVITVNRARAAQNAFSLLKAWKGYPGEGLPEAEQDAKLEAWAAEVLAKTREDRRGRVGSVHVAEVLARVPEGRDGFWPCLAARRLLETGLYPHLGEHLSLAKRNLRGMTGRALDEGGVQERELADKYREAARQVEAIYPRTANMLDSLARGYDREAEREDAEARRFRIEHGEQPEEPEEPPSTPRDTATAPRTEFISRIVTIGVGPARRFDVPLHPRLNLLIGDNSLGKTFILEVLWWALTGAWADPKLPAKPGMTEHNGGAISVATIRAEAGGRHRVGEYDRAREIWKKKGARSLAPGLALYARADGSFCVWDPIRNVRPADKTEQDLSKGYRFPPQDLWYGLLARDGRTKLCRGLLEDAVSWPSDRKKAFALLAKVLETLSPPPPEPGQSQRPIKFRRPERFQIRDASTYPKLDLGYGKPIFAVHASAAVKRILGLAYAIVWAVSELQEVAPMAGHAPLRRVTVLIDEIEAHLHPRWQRAILPAVLSVMEDLAPQVQLIVTTHAPLVLASVETLFDPAKDALFEFEEFKDQGEGNPVRVVEEPWAILGDVNTWLIQHFGLKQPRRREAEEAIEEASKAMKSPKLSKKEGKAIHEKLGKVLGELDPFWVRWQYIAEKRGWVS